MVDLYCVMWHFALTFSVQKMFSYINSNLGGRNRYRADKLAIKSNKVPPLLSHVGRNMTGLLLLFIDKLLAGQ